MNEWVDTSKVGLSNAKIIFFIKKSPCQNCMKRIEKLSHDFATKLGNGKGVFEFSFVWENHYVGTKSDEYDTVEDADNAYELKNQTNNVYKKTDLEVLILIRQIVSTKGGTNHIKFAEPPK